MAEIIIKRKGITITKMSSRIPTWYENYRVDNKEILEFVNKIWKDIRKKKRKVR